MKYMDLLGCKCRDKITNIEGVIESVSYDLYGCIQVALKLLPDKKWNPTKDMPKTYWFDAKRMEKLTSPLIEVPDFEPETGPADLPPRS